MIGDVEWNKDVVWYKQEVNTCNLSVSLTSSNHKIFNTTAYFEENLSDVLRWMYFQTYWTNTNLITSTMYFRSYFLFYDISDFY